MNITKKDRLYKIYHGMKGRCYNPTNSAYYKYGEKGIKICNEWILSSSSFYKWALENGYTDDLTIDRIEGTKDYEPGNCRWATPLEQSLNRKTRSDSKSGHTGVRKYFNKYICYITVNKKQNTNRFI